MNYPFGTVLRDPTDGEVVMSLGRMWSDVLALDRVLLLVPRQHEFPESVGEFMARGLDNGIWEVVDEEADD